MFSPEQLFDCVPQWFSQDSVRLRSLEVECSIPAATIAFHRETIGKLFNVQWVRAHNPDNWNYPESKTLANHFRIVAILQRLNCITNFIAYLIQYACDMCKLHWPNFAMNHVRSCKPRVSWKLCAKTHLLWVNPASIKAASLGQIS